MTEFKDIFSRAAVKLKGRSLEAKEHTMLFGVEMRMGIHLRCVYIMRTFFKKICKNVKQLNNSMKGFTMLEMLFSFTLFCLFTSFLPPLFQILFADHSIEARIQRMEWEVFVSQIKKEIQTSDDINIVNSQLVLLDGEEMITFQKYGSQIRRLVNMRGHEIVLQNVASVQFEKRGRNVSITVVDIYEHSNMTTIYPFIVMEKSG